ncbi:MAG: hypothetical protein ACTSWJ_07260, partial [Candidatus Heimdallarchaeaceae archaeon]
TTIQKLSSELIDYYEYSSSDYISKSDFYYAVALALVEYLFSLVNLELGRYQGIDIDLIIESSVEGVSL